MAKLDFNINDEMINTIRVYQQLKDKHIKKHNVKSAKEDEYINRLTTNAFSMLSDQIPNEYLSKGGSINYTQWRWIWDLAMNRNKRVFTRERHNKTQMVYHKMETPKRLLHGREGYTSIPTQHITPTRNIQICFMTCIKNWVIGQSLQS